MKTSKGVILSQASQIKSNYSFALIKATADNKSLVQNASSAELKVNALVEYSKDSQWDPKKLTSLGFPAGCFLIVDLRGQDIHAADLITNLALVRQYGYQAGAIDDLSTLDDIKVLKANQIYLINSGKANDDQDASLNGDEITDGSGKLAVGMSVKWQRDYTNVDVSGDHAGFVGMGQDTLLKGGNAFGYSTNGRDFNAVITPKGLIFRRPDAERMWRLLKPSEIADINSTVGDKVKKEVDSATAEIPAAVSAANSAVQYAESAVAASKVNSDAIVAQSEAISEAKAAMDSATAEIQQTAANAASDAAKIRADVAQVQSEVDTAKAANSASVEALKSDVSAAKQDLADVHDNLTKAQAAAEESQKAIDNSIAQINSDIEQDRKDIASAQQANADMAKQLDTYSKQAQDQGKTIKSIQDKQDSFTATLADVQGNVTQVSDKVDGLSASLKDAQDNVASVKAQADQLSATLTDHAKSIATLTASAKELSSTLEDADGRLSKVEQTAQTNSSTLSDVQSDLSQVKQDATTLTATLKDAQGNISTLQQKADSVSAQLASAQGDISTLKKTSTDVTSKLKDHDGRISKAEQTASTLVNEFADQQGHLSRVEQTAQGTQQTVANQQGQINDIKTDAAGIHETLTGQGDQIANINVTLNGLNTKYEGVSGDLGKLKNGAMQNRGTVSAPDFNSLTAAGFYTITHPYRGKNYPTGNWGTLEVSGQTSDSNGRLNQKYVSDNNAETYVRQYNANTKSWTAWIKTANQNDVTALSNRITTNSTQITQNKQAIALKADQSTVNNLSGEVSQAQAQLKVQAGQISSKVSSEDFKTLDNKVGGAIAQIDKNTTAIDQTNKQISLKADQTEVNQVKQTATQNSSRLDVMAGQISSKVTSTDVNNIVDSKGYATTSTVQSLITQKAGAINENITNLDAKYNTTVTQVQSLTASIDGIQSTVANKADKSQITQLSNLVQSKVSTSDFNSKITQLSNDINLRVITKDDLLGQINIQAGNTLIQNGRIYLDANSIVFGKNSRAIIPSAAIGNLDAAKITTGSISVPMSDGKNNSISFEDDGVVIKSKGKSSDFYDANEGTSKLKITGAGVEFISSTDNDENIKRLGIMTPTTYQNVNTSGMTFVVTGVGDSSSGTLNDRGAFFSLARKTLSYPLDYKGMIYATGEMGDLDTGFHFNDPVYIHPYGAETGIRSTWCSWSSMGNRKFPVLVNSDHGWSGIAFPIWGQAFVFSNNGYVARPNQKIDSYSGYGEGNRDYFDSTDPNQKH